MSRRKIQWLLSITLLVCSLFCFTFTVNAAGVTKTATAHTITQSVTSFHPVTKSISCTHTKHDSVATTVTYPSLACDKCGATTNPLYGYYDDTTCATYGVWMSYPSIRTCSCEGYTDHEYTHTVTDWCPQCKKANVDAADYYKHEFKCRDIGYLTNYTCSYVITTSPTPPAAPNCDCTFSKREVVTTHVGYGHTGTTTTSRTDYYYSTEYAYKGNSSTFSCYPLIVAGHTGITVTGNGYTATKTDYVCPGNTVKVSFDNPNSMAVNITVNGVTSSLPEGSTSYSFTMPAADTNINIDVVSVTVSPTAGKTSLTVGEQTQIIPNNTDGSTVTYSSSNASGLEVTSGGGF